MEVLSLGEGVQALTVEPHWQAHILFLDWRQQQVVLPQKCVEYLVASYAFREKFQLKVVQCVMLDDLNAAPLWT